jgi:hypothetical protein
VKLKKAGNVAKKIQIALNQHFVLCFRKMKHHGLTQRLTRTSQIPQVKNKLNARKRETKHAVWNSFSHLLGMAFLTNMMNDCA